jgi:hypothetical protein
MIRHEEHHVVCLLELDRLWMTDEMRDVGLVTDVSHLNELFERPHVGSVTGVCVLCAVQ